MTTKIINGKKCELRDVVYNDFGAVTTSEKIVAELKSTGSYKTDSGRKELFNDIEYSWKDDDNTYEYYQGDDSNEDLTILEQEELDREFSENSDSADSVDIENDTELLDKEFSTGTLPMRLVTLKKPIHIQLKNLYREHSRVYKSKGNKMKSSDIELLMMDFRYELNRLILLTKNKIVESGGNMDMIMKVSSIKGGNELQKSMRELSILFRRIQSAHDKFGFIPRNLQTKLTDLLSILHSHFVMDVYGTYIEKRKMESLEEEDKNTKQDE